MKKMNLALAAVLAVAAVPAFAGNDRYEFHKDCTFHSATFGDFKIRVMKNEIEHDRLVIVQQGAMSPVAFDDLMKEIKYECNRTLKKVVVPYAMGAITELKVYEDETDPNYGRLKIVYTTAAPTEQRCGHYTCRTPMTAEQTLEVPNCGTTPQW